MNFIRIENFRLTDRNKASGDAVFEVDRQQVKADFIFYLQSNDCLSIRIGRHDPRLTTAQLEDYIKENRLPLRQMVKPEVERVRRQAREKYIDEQA